MPSGDAPAEEAQLIPAATYWRWSYARPVVGVPRPRAAKPGSGSPWDVSGTSAKCQRAVVFCRAYRRTRMNKLIRRRQLWPDDGPGRRVGTMAIGECFAGFAAYEGVSS
jgi:hypothetical protein